MKKKETKQTSTKPKWQETVIYDKPTTKCDHYFQFIDGETLCIKCHMGLIGVVELEDGKPKM